MHLVALTRDVRYDLLFVSDSRFLFFDQTVGDALELRSHWVEHAVVVSNSVLFFLFNHPFEFVPSQVIKSLLTCGDGCEPRCL